MTKLLIANMKMYPTLSDALVLTASYKKAIEDLRNIDLVIAPPLPWLVSTVESVKTKPTNLYFGAQNIYPEDQGAYTGEISPYLLKNIASYAIIGHSERRLYQQEDNDLINDKVHSCLRWQVKPVLCVGEKTHSVSSPAASHKFLSDELMSALEGVNQDSIHKVTIAYEPIWAIGTGQNATAEYVLSIIEFLKTKIADKYGHDKASSVKFLYGGSVSDSNAGDYLKHPEISGLLVGKVSIKAKEFIDICKIASGVN